MSDRRHLTPVPTNGHSGDLTPPHDNTAERAVLGAMLHGHHDTLTTTTHTITPHDHYRPAHELIHAAIEHLYSRGEPIDLVTVGDHLHRTNQLDRAGGRPYLAELYTNAPVQATATYHARIIAEHSSRRRLLNLGNHLRAIATTPGDLDLPTLITDTTTRLHDLPTHIPGIDNTPTSTWAPVNIADILEHGEDIQQPTLLARVDGHHLLYPAAVHSISGEPESGKTWVALIAATQHLRDGGHVTYIDFEDRAGRVIPRLINLGAPPHAIRDHFHYIRPTTALDPTGATHLDQAATNSALAIIDGVTEAMTLHGLSLMDNEDAARFLDLLPRRLADHGCAVLQIDHVVKDTEKQGRWAIGAGHKLAGLDGAAYGIKVIEPFGRGRAGRARITVHKDRPGAVREIASGNTVAELVLDSRGGPLAARIDPPSETPRGADGELRPTHLMESVSRYIEANPGITARQIEAAIKGKRDYIRLAIKTLILEGFVVTEQAGQAIHHHSVNAFREDPR